MKSENRILPDLDSRQWTALIVLRILIGWHLLYEGFVKLLDPGWTSAMYLKESTWIFSGVFQAIAANADLLSFVDFINQWLLIVLGFTLIAGLFTQASSVSAMFLLLLYYLAQPPLFQYGQGDHLIVNMVLIEVAALFILSRFATGKVMGIDRLFYLKRGENG